MKRKRIATVFALTLCLITAALSGCANTKQDAANQPNQASGGVLRVGMECAYAPFNWSQTTDTLPDGSKAIPINGTNYYAGGYDVMVSKMIADTLGMELQIHKVEWASIGMGLDIGDYDCVIAGMGLTEERAALYEFTSAYYLRDLCLTVKADGPFADITKLSDFAGRKATAITQMGTAWVDNLSQIPDMVPAANYETTAECFMAIATGVADVCMVDLPTSLSAAMTNSNLKILELNPDDNLDSSRQNKVCIALKKGNTQLRDTIQGALDKLEWDADKMNKLMDEAIKLQPSVE